MQSAMEQTKYWMWNRSKLGGSPLLEAPILPKVTSSYSDSWEEQAFAEDSAGRLGCVWPPRSYSCSFCRREFRSAQALGGHMNVHRRDRARLKQSPIPHSESILHHHHHRHEMQTPINPYMGLASQSPPQICSLVYNYNPNPNPSRLGALSLSPSRVSGVSTKENCSEQTFLSSSYPPVVHEKCKATFFPATRSISDSFPVRKVDVTELRLGRENSKPREIEISSTDDEEVEEISCKRRKTDAPLDAPLPFFLRPTLAVRNHHRSEVTGFGPSPTEELDLELKL